MRLPHNRTMVNKSAPKLAAVPSIYSSEELMDLIKECKLLRDQWIQAGPDLMPSPAEERMRELDKILGPIDVVRFILDMCDEAEARAFTFYGNREAMAKTAIDLTFKLRSHEVVLRDIAKKPCKCGSDIMALNALMPADPKVVSGT